MPARNTVKQYIENGYYHLYNRGVEKRLTFLDSQDYAVFLSYLKEYLLPKDVTGLNERLADSTISSKERDKILKALRLNNFANEIVLLAYCLMPNHFHLFIKQKSPSSIDKFMQSLGTRYTMYFNRKYKRVGSLFQAVYKAALVIHEEHYLHLTKYIHQQSIQLIALPGETLKASEQPSSYKEYIGLRHTEWVKPDEILSYFSETSPSLSYQAFIKEVDNSDSIKYILFDD